MSRRESFAEAMARRSLRAFGRWLIARHAHLDVAGQEHVPATGPLLLAARHYHHLYDGCALLAAVPRPLYLLVALDWADHGLARLVMPRACRLARWPVVMRADARPRPGVSRPAPPAKAQRALLRATNQVVELMRGGQALAIFPEAYPTIDPEGSRKADDQEVLPFRPGLARLALLAERRGAGPIPIVPAGLQYARGDRWRIQLRFGAPLHARDYADWRALTAALEEQVVALSEARPVHRPAADQAPGREGVAHGAHG